MYCILGIAMTGVVNDSDAITSNNQLEDYSYITERGGTSLLANCVTGASPTGSNNNTLLVGWYFGGSEIASQRCRGNGVAVLSGDYAGVYQLQQCGTFTTAVEGIYSCQTFNSEFFQQVIRLGVYLDGRSKCNSFNWSILYMSLFVAVPIIDPPSPSNVVIAIGSSLTMSCTSRGSPPDRFTWRKDSGPVVQSTAITRVTYNINDAVFRASYSIYNATTSDGGIYACTMANPIGRDSETITVTVVGMSDNFVLVRFKLLW